MRRVVFPIALLLFSALAQAQLPTTTTHLQQTANNTSAANSFLTQSNGNLGAGNISKLPIRSLLYPGSTTKLYAHVEPWWGSGSHINIGYSSQDPAQVHRQVQDMVSRGLDGAVVDWYGPGSYEDTGVKLLLAEAQATPNFSILVEIDVGAINWHSCYPTCSATTAVIDLFTAANTNFFSSPAITKWNNRAVLMEFGMETLTLPSDKPTGWNVIDWNAVQTQTPGNLAIVHRNLGGYTKAQSTGAFVWMEPKTVANFVTGFDDTIDLTWFYSNSIQTYPTMPAHGAAWKGFDDTLADWAPPGGRHIDQNCGQTWLRTFATINQYYSASNQLPTLQLVTWNDYEEGTEVETGIDNCLNLTASLNGKQLQWSPGGDESTLDHYTVYLSADGQNLASLGDFAPGVNNVDLASYAVPAGDYTAYVQAVGKPSIRNHMSAGVGYTAGNTPQRPARPSVVKVTATPPAQSVASGATAQYTLTVSADGVSDPVTLTCSGLPAGSTCSFSEAAVAPNASGTQVQMSVVTATQIAQSDHGPALAILFSGFGLLGLAGAPVIRWRKMIAAGGLLLALLLTQVACGGGSIASNSAKATIAKQAQTYTITVAAVSGEAVHSTVVTLTVN